ncbi:hypothetical protein Tco_0007614 [Tanacetum coccineum]
MVDLIQNNLAVEERLDKQGTRLYNLENLNIPHKVSQAVDEIVTDAVDWAMQAPLRVRFRDLPTVDMNEIIQQRMFEDDSYKTHTIHNDLYEALQKSFELDYSNQHLADQEEAHKKRRKRHDVPITPPGSPPSQPPPPPPLAGASGAPGTSGASGYESPGVFGTHELSPNDSLMQDDSIPEEQVHLSDDEDSETDHQSKADSRKDWWKPLPEEEIPATPEPTWTIPSSNKSYVANNWASALATTYEHPAENSLLAKTGDMTIFLKWYCRQVNKTTLTQADFEGRAYEVVKAFYPDVIHLQFQMEIRLTGRILKEIKSESMSTDHCLSVDLHVMLLFKHNFFNKDLEYLWYGSKGSYPALSISKMKVANYPDFGLELLVPEQMWIDDVCTYDISANYGISHWWFTRQKFYIDRHYSPLRRKDVRTHMRILSVTQLNLSKLGWDATGYEFKHDYTIIESPRVVVFPVNNNERKIMRFNEIYKFSDGTLTRILEALAYRVKEFKIKRLNPGISTRFWTEKDVTRSKEFIAAIERRLKTRRIYRNLECFVGGRVRDIDYRLLQRT